MNKNYKWFTFVEIIVVLIIMVLIMWFWFSKISDFFWYDDTLNNIEEINRNIIENKINSNFNNSKNIIYFNKKFDWFYSIYNEDFEKENNFFINSGSLDKETLNLNFSSDNIISKNQNIIVEDWKNIIWNNIYFNADWTSNEIISIEFKRIYDNKIYIKDNGGGIITWFIKIIPNSYKNDLVLSRIIWTNFSNNELDYDMLKIINWKNGKSIIYWYKNNEISQLIKVRLSFVDSRENFWYLDIN